MPVSVVALANICCFILLIRVDIERQREQQADSETAEVSFHVSTHPVK